MNGKYFTPTHIIDPAAGTGAYLHDVHDYIVGNPPYGGHVKPTYDPGLQLTPFGRRLIDWLAVACFLAGTVALTIEAIPAGLIGATLWLIAIGLHKWAEGGCS